MRLAPLGAVRAFEATARLASVKAAAAELNVTPTAVSHQLRLLEESLGVRLLERSPRRVALTIQGRDLFDAAHIALDGLDAAFNRINADSSPRTVTLSATAAFLSAWLVPRLADLQSILGPVGLKLHASDAIADLKEGFIDVAIRYAMTPGPDSLSQSLGPDQFVPVCSPMLMPVNFDSAPMPALIHLEGSVASLPLPDWRTWFDTVGLRGLSTRAGLRVTSSLHAIQAAIAGQGVALVSFALAQDALSAGLLVRPHEHTTLGASYHFVHASTLGKDAVILRLRDWFKRSFELGRT
jgi:LysR family transcriptional regulator, glycine cleavage system transcriptional activator